MVIIYTDGACSGNGKSGAIGGIGVYCPLVSSNGISIGYKNVTNNIMELMAIKWAIEYIDQTLDKEIYTDSMYSINIFETWLQSWIKKGICNEKKNMTLILSMQNSIDNHIGKIKFVHLRGHCKSCELLYKNNLPSDTRPEHIHCHGNIIADHLATDAKKGELIAL